MVNTLEFAQDYPRPVLFLSQHLVGILAEDFCQDLGSLKGEPCWWEKRAVGENVVLDKVAVQQFLIVSRNYLSLI